MVIVVVIRTERTDNLAHRKAKEWRCSTHCCCLQDASLLSGIRHTIVQNKTFIAKLRLLAEY